MIQLVRQRAEGDCGSASLATFLSAAHAYEDVYLEVAKHDPKKRGKGGLYNRELVAIAAALGVTLEACRAFDLDRDEGLLRVRSTAHYTHGHWVAVRYGLVWDPADGFASPWREYAERHDARFSTLLRWVRGEALAAA